MYSFKTPNYKEDNIVNLMSSISNTFGKKHDYNQLSSLKSDSLLRFDNIVLVVIDGLGYNYLNKQKDSFLYKNISQKLTSTFLSTTACANTVFQVGYPPQQHGLTGWTINLKETAGVAEMLTFKLKGSGTHLTDHGFEVQDIMNIEAYHKGFNGECISIVSEEKSRRNFIKYVARETRIIGTKTYQDTFITLSEILNSKSKNKRFIHAYMDELDGTQHNYGVNGEETNNLFKSVDFQIQQVVESIQGTNTKLIIVSDHGLLDIPSEHEIWVDDIEGLTECLTIPITGEPRVRDCFVRPGKVKKFKKITENQLSKYCWCFEGEQLINDNFYGLGKANKKLLDRVGDYVLIMKDNYVLKDHTNKSEKASHGSFSDDEMLVPLILIDC